jgi:hypothetical protein
MLGLVGLLVIGVVSFTPVPPYDLWWHLKVGQLVATHGIPTTNLFAWAIPADQPFVYGEWLGGWLLYQLYVLGGFAGPPMIRNGLAVLLFLWLGLLIYRQSRALWMVSVLIPASLLLTYNNLHVRPQIWGWLPFLACVWVAHALHPPAAASYASQQGNVPLTAALAMRMTELPLLLLPIIMIVWVNVHGSFVLGLGFLGLTLAGETLTTALALPHALAWRQIAMLARTILGCFLATLLNPQGVRVYDYVWVIVTNPTIRTTIQEWQPPQWFHLSGASFYLSLGIVVAVSVLRWRRLTIAQALVLIGFSTLALTSLRMVFWYTLVIIPIVAHLLAPHTGYLPQRGTAQPTNASQRQNRAPLQGRAGIAPTATERHRYTNMLIVGIGIFSFGLMQPPLRGVLPLHRLFHQDTIDVPGAPGTYRNDTPVAAIEYVRQHPRPGRIFNDVGVGSYLIWAMGIDQPVYIDTRIELFPAELWQEYLAIARADNYNGILIEKYNMTRVILNKADQRGLLQALASDPRWQEEFSDRKIAIYRRALP